MTTNHFPNRTTRIKQDSTLSRGFFGACCLYSGIALAHIEAIRLFPLATYYISQWAASSCGSAGWLESSDRSIRRCMPTAAATAATGTGDGNGNGQRSDEEKAIALLLTTLLSESRYTLVSDSYVSANLYNSGRR